MMSLDNVFEVSELEAWGERVEKNVDGAEFVCEMKIDGLGPLDPLRKRQVRAGRNPW